MQTISHEGSDSAALRKLEVNLRMRDGHKRKIKVGRDEGGAAEEATSLRDELRDARRMGADAMIDRTLRHFGVERGQVEKIEIEVKYADGLEIEVELENQAKAADCGAAGQPTSAENG